MGEVSYHSLAKVIKSISACLLCDLPLQKPVIAQMVCKRLFHGLDRWKQRQRHITL